MKLHCGDFFSNRWDVLKVSLALSFGIIEVLFLFKSRHFIRFFGNILCVHSPFRFAWEKCLSLHPWFEFLFSKVVLHQFWLFMEGNYLVILSWVAKNFIPDGTQSCQRIFSKLDLKLALVCEIQLCQLLLHDFILSVEFGQGEGLYIKSRYQMDIKMSN